MKASPFATIFPIPLVLITGVHLLSKLGCGLCSVPGQLPRKTPPPWPDDPDPHSPLAVAAKTHHIAKGATHMLNLAKSAKAAAVATIISTSLLSSMLITKASSPSPAPPIPSAVSDGPPPAAQPVNPVRFDFGIDTSNIILQGVRMLHPLFGEVFKSRLLASRTAFREVLCQEFGYRMPKWSRPSSFRNWKLKFWPLCLHQKKWPFGFAIKA